MRGDRGDAEFGRRGRANSALPYVKGPGQIRGRKVRLAQPGVAVLLGLPGSPRFGWMGWLERIAGIFGGFWKYLYYEASCGALDLAVVVAKRAGRDAGGTGTAFWGLGRREGCGGDERPHPSRRPKPGRMGHPTQRTNTTRDGAAWPKGGRGFRACVRTRKTKPQRLKRLRKKDEKT